MSNIKKGFLNAGSIIAIIFGAFLVLSGIIACYASKIANEKFVVEMFKEDSSYTYFADDLTTDEVGDYYFIYTDENGMQSKLTASDIITVVELTKSILIGMGIFILLLALANIWLAIVILRRTSKNRKCTGLTISLMITSLIVCNFLTMAFMIVALCLRDKPDITIENNNQYGEQDIILN